MFFLEGAMCMLFQFYSFRRDKCFINVIIVNVQSLVETLKRLHIVSGFEVFDALNRIIVSPHNTCTYKVRLIFAL